MAQELEPQVIGPCNVCGYSVMEWLGQLEDAQVSRDAYELIERLETLEEMTEKVGNACHIALPYTKADVKGWLDEWRRDVEKQGKNIFFSDEDRRRYSSALHSGLYTVFEQDLHDAAELVEAKLAKERIERL